MPEPSALLLTADSARDHLADALLAAGPDGPTLCEGWQAADLAVHLWVRESRPDLTAGKLAGRVIAPLHEKSSQAMDDLLTAARTPAGFTSMVDRFRAGPPTLSVFSVPRLGQAANLMEYFIHLLDVTKAGSIDATPALDDDYAAAVWSQLTGPSSLFYFRSSPVGVILCRPDGVRKAVKRSSSGSVIVSGSLPDLVLMASGRPAAVEIDGDEADVRRFKKTKPRL